MLRSPSLWTHSSGSFIEDLESYSAEFLHCVTDFVALKPIESYAFFSWHRAI